MIHGVRFIPLPIFKFAGEMSAYVTGKDSSIFSRSDLVFLRGGDDGSSIIILSISSETTPEKGRGVAMGYLNPVAARAQCKAKFDDLAAYVVVGLDNNIPARGATDIKLLSIMINVVNLCRL